MYFLALRISSPVAADRALIHGNPLAAPAANTAAYAMVRSSGGDQKLVIRSNLGETVDIEWAVWRGLLS